MGGLWSKGLERAQTGEERLEDKTLNPTTILNVQSFIIKFLKQYMSHPPVRFQTTGNIVRWNLPGNVNVSYCLTNDCLIGHMCLIRNTLLCETKMDIYDSMCHQLFTNIKKYNQKGDESILTHIN